MTEMVIDFKDIFDKKPKNLIKEMG